KFSLIQHSLIDPEVVGLIFSFIGTVTHLVLSNVTGITNIPPLDKVQILELIQLQDLEDISSIGNHSHDNRIKLKTVTIVGCNRIKDFTSLRNIPDLAIRYCHSPKNL